MNKAPVSIQAHDVSPRTSSIYPTEFADAVKGRAKRVLGNVFGLSQFGVNLTELAPGSWSALRHWHAEEDEFIYVLEGEITLIDEQGEHVLSKGSCVGFKAGVQNGRHLVNKSAKPASYLEIGTRSDSEHVVYPDADLIASKRPGEPYVFTRRDGSSFTK